MTFKIRMIALYIAMPSKTLADLSVKRTEIREGVAIGAFRSILFLLFFVSFCYRRCVGVKIKLILNFSMKLKSVYTVFKTAKYLFEYFYRKIAATQ